MSDGTANFFQESGIELLPSNFAEDELFEISVNKFCQMRKVLENIETQFTNF